MSSTSVPIASLSIVLPAYNEEANIRGAIDAAQTAADDLKLPYEIIVVDDGSADGTAECVTAISAGGYAGSIGVVSGESRLWRRSSRRVP